MKILYLCSKYYWLNKMSRVRFHSIDALERHPEIDLIKSGPGWPDFISCKQVQNKYNPDLVLWYKPLEMSGYEQVTVPRCLRYNEMWSIGETIKEIKNSGSKYVVCHHENDIPNYQHMSDKGYKFFHSPHCAEKEVFKDYGLQKEYDILLVGVISPEIYPLRSKFQKVLQGLSGRYRCRILNHPGYRITNINEQVEFYAKEINKAKVVVSCSSKYQYALAKYIEIGMCGSVLCADIPNERQDWYRKWMLPVNPEDGVDRIARVLMDCLEDKSRVIELSLRARELCNHTMTQEHYAERLVNFIKDEVL